MSRIAWILPAAAVAAVVVAAAPHVSWKRPPVPSKAGGPAPGGIEGSAAPAKGPAGAPAAAALPAKITFNEHVRPILANNCFRCHGPDPGAREAKLRLDRPEFAFAPREDGKPVIVKGDPSASAVVRRITSKDPEEMMPPPDSHKTLQPGEIALLTKWIADGAEYQAHWSFLKPVRPPEPDVKRKDWPKNPVDRFILARLEAEGLAPNPEAGRRTLIRRATLDLLGLPPTPEEVEAFVNDPAPDAYEKLVDRLLARPEYGEHRGRYWLDNVRYADTHGYHFDNYRSIWPYRDWVIAAFNANQPFDQFTIEQFAGDLLPSPTLEQRVATGFIRCAMSTNEGGTIPEEYEAIYAKDRVETTAQVWMGLTMGCATCHDHKFDPLTQKDFYALAAFFRNTTQPPMDGNVMDSPPVVRIPRAEDADRLAKLPGEVDRAKKALDARIAAAEPAFLAWHKGKGPGDVPDVTAAGLVFRLVPDAADPKIVRDLATEGRSFTFEGAPAADPSPHGPGVLLTEGASADLGDLGDVDSDQPFSYGAWVKLPDNSNGALLARMEAPDKDYRGWDLWTQASRGAAHIIHKWPSNALKVAARGPLPHGQWRHLFVTYDGSKKPDGLKIYYDGKEQPVYVEANTLTDTIRTKTPLRLGRRGGGMGATGAAVHDVRFYHRLLSPAEVAVLARRGALAAGLMTPPDLRKTEQLGPLREYFLDFVDADTVRLRGAHAALQAELEMIRDRGQVSLVTEEKKEAPFANILIRGQYDKKGEKVGAGVPAALPPLPPDAPVNRLGLARWLVSPEHPLTARVNVNRFWAQVFGTGLVPTAGDFGITGQPPVNPPLLDWLAVEFREKGWDVKRFFRLLLTSAAYRQSALATPEKLAKDPDNRLLSRGPRFRMDGEMLRDQALAASGLLTRKMGGPSVKPYQPAGLWEVVAMEESNTKQYVPDTGESLYRRSLYTFWKRAAPPPAMETFNAPSREECSVSRERTNTPLQALVTLNDVQFVEASRRLAADAITSGGVDDGARLDAMAMRVLARPLAADEKAALEKTVTGLRARYAKDPKAAEALLKVGESPADAAIPAPELAAWTMVGSQFFNLDEALNK